jgi:DNA-binding MarR family transcriptional regulator
LSVLLLDVLPPLIRAIRAAMREYRGARFTVPQFRVLGFVSLQPCTSKQIAEWQGVSVAAMSRMVGTLVRRGMLRRTPDVADRRQIELRLSRRGKNEFARLRQAIEAALAARLALLPAARKRALGTGLTALEELFRET